MTRPLLEVHDLHVELEAGATPVRPVDGVSFEVRAGETLGIVGESGCGKTMTAFSIIGLLPPNGRITRGSIAFEGEELTGLRSAELRRVRGDKIGMVFQDPMTSLNPTMTIFDQVAEPLILHRQVGSREIRDRVLETLQLVGLPDPEARLKAYPHQLSGGLRQRVAIAIALVCQPKLLLADEPSTALDVTIQRQILDLIDELRRRLDMSVVLITHDLGVVAGHTDRVAVMYAGRIAETADTATLFLNPKHRYTEGLFAALPERAANRHQPLYTITGAPPDLANPPDGCRFAPRCAFATDECRVADPPLREAGPEHLFACVHPVGGERGEASEIKPSISISAMVGSAGSVRQPVGRVPLPARRDRKRDTSWCRSPRPAVSVRPVRSCLAGVMTGSMAQSPGASPTRRLGAFRYVDRAKVLSALATVKRGEVISLNLPLDCPPLVDPPAGRPPLRRIARMHNQIRPRSDGSFVVVNDDVIELAMQGSTHWDALAHWGAIEPNDQSVYFGGAGLTETYPEFGTKTLGIDQLAAGVVTRGVLLDLVREMEGPEALFLEDGHNVGLADVQACLEREKVELAPGDAVFTYTGFQHRLRHGSFAPRGPDGVAGERQAPGLLLETLPFWRDAKVFALCSDNPSVEPIPMPEGRFHTLALKHMGIQLGELFALDELVDECRRDSAYEFLLVSTPLNVRGAFGSPANAVAIR